MATDMTHKRKVLRELSPFPAWLQELARRAGERERMRVPPDQATVQWYGQDSYIDAHVDDPKCFKEDILTVSLVSSALYWLTDGVRVVAQIVEPGDVVTLRGEARKDWKHGIMRPKLNKTLQVGAARIITAHGSPRLELGVGGVERASWRRLSVTFRSVVPERVVHPDV